MSDGFLENMSEKLRGRLLGSFLSVSTALGLGSVADDVYAGRDSLYATHMESGARIKPIKRVGTSMTWVVGENEPLFVESDHAQKNKDPLDQQFYTSSLVKSLVFVAVMRKIEADEVAVSKGEMSAENALTYDRVLVISDRAKELSDHRSFEDELTVREALPLLLSFSMNDVAHAFAERIAFGRKLDSDISVKQSKALEKTFVLDHMRPLTDKLGMDNTFLVNATGLPTYRDAKKSIPTWSNNVSTPRDMMTLFNFISEAYPEYTELSSVAEIKMPNRVKVFKNSNPLLEDSTKDENDRAQSIPIDGVDGGKTGVSALSLWNVVLYYDGENGRLAVLSTGNDNEEYAQAPKAALEKGIDALQMRLLYAQSLIEPQYCPMPAHD